MLASPCQHRRTIRSLYRQLDSNQHVNAPEARIYHTAVWTGSRMIVWGGGYADIDEVFNTGGRYNPTTDSWTATSTANAPDARDYHTSSLDRQ